jgi:LysR family transcriptional regulator, nitrogen assimilation regulatory protein
MYHTFDLRRLRYFLAICEHGSLSAAARALNIAQPALSYHVGELERLSELSLMVRRSTGIRLTAHGEALRRHAIAIIERVDEAERAMADRAHRCRPGEQVRLAIITSLAAELTPRLLERVGRIEQGPTLSIMEAGTRDMEARIAQGRIDMAVCLAASPRLLTRQIANEELLLVCPQGMSLESPLPEDRLSDLRFVLPTPGNPLRDFVEQSVRRRGFFLDVALEVDGPGSRFNSVASGIGCTLLGAHSIPAAALAKGLVILSIAPPLERPIFLARSAGLDRELGDRMETIITASLDDLGIHALATGNSAPHMV